MQDGHRPYKEDLAAYLLDALSAEEAHAFEAHLASCPHCQAEERWLQAAVAILPSSVEQVEPSPEIRKRLMETVRAESAATKRPEAQRGHERSRLGFLLRPATAGIAAVAVAIAGLAGYLIGQGEGPNTTTVAARATPAEPTASGDVVRSGDIALLRVKHLPPERPRHVYEVWLSRKGSSKLEPSTLFSVGADGTGSAAIPGGLDGVNEVLVSEEPASGSTKPTSDPVMRARF